MKSVLAREQKSSEYLSYWTAAGNKTRKPIGCSFGILKNTFQALEDRLTLQHENNCTYVACACIFLPKICIKDEFNEDCNVDILVEDKAEKTVATSAAKILKGRPTTLSLYQVTLNSFRSPSS